jgi:hypothetical protein
MQGAPQEFLQFLRRLDREFPLDLALHLTMDNLLVGIDCFAVLVGAFAAAMNRSPSRCSQRRPLSHQRFSFIPIYSS